MVSFTNGLGEVAYRHAREGGLTVTPHQDPSLAAGYRYFRLAVTLNA